MKSIRSFRGHLLVMALSFILLEACAPKISLYNETAFQQAVNLKVDSLALIENAYQPFEQYRDEVRRHRIELLKALEFAKGRPDNEHSVQQWEIMVDPDRNMLGGFLKRWEEAGSMSPIFISEAMENIAAGFDTIIGLESGKIKSGEL